MPIKSGNGSLISLAHRVVLCSMQDVVEKDGTMTLAREKVSERWAAIIQKKGSFFTREGRAVEPGKDPRSQRTHIITIRFDASIEISGAAWIYERRLKSAPRWYKVLDVSDDAGQWYNFDARLVERNDTASPPVAQSDAGLSALGAQPLPEGVKL